MPIINWKRIIHRMLELAKRWGPYLLTASAAFTAGGVVAYTNQLSLASIAIEGLAFACLVCAIIVLIYDIKDVRRKYIERKNRKHEIKFV